MPSSAARKGAASSVPRSFAWFLAPDGRFLHADGPGVSAVGRTIEGAHYQQTAADCPELLSVLAGALDGRSFSGSVERDGNTWHIEAHPVYVDGALIGVSGASVVVDGVPGDLECGDCQVWVASGDNGAYGVESDDRFVRRRGWQGYMQLRMVSESVFEAYRRANERRVHLIQNFRPQPGRRLRVIR